MITIDNCKGRFADYTIVVHNLTTGEVFDAVPEKAVADIASQFRISNEAALVMLEDQLINDKPEIVCPNKDASFWLERIAH